MERLCHGHSTTNSYAEILTSGLYIPLLTFTALNIHYETVVRAPHPDVESASNLICLFLLMKAAGYLPAYLALVKPSIFWPTSTKPRNF